MKRTRTIIRKLPPPPPDGLLETELWPLAIALCVTASLAAGVVAVLLRGPWLWGTLLALPLVVGICLLLMQRIASRLIRRALQFAALCSLAIHLLIVLAAAFTQIFPTTNPSQEIVTTPQRSERVVFVQRQRDIVPWPPANAALPVDETAIEAEPVRHERVTKSAAEPQLLPTTTASESALTCREQPATPALAMAESPSQRSRSESAVAPTSGASPLERGESMTARARPAVAAAPLPTEREGSAAQPSSSLRSIEPPRETNQMSANSASSLERAAAETPSASEAPAERSPSARQRNRSVEIRQTAAVPSTGDSQPTNRTSVTRAEAASPEPARSVEPQQLADRSTVSLPEPPRDEVAAQPLTSPRREPTDSANRLAALDEAPRPARALIETSAQPTTTTPLESPAPSPTSATTPRVQPKMADTASTRGEQNAELAQRQRNFSPDAQSSRGAAAAPSAAARREATLAANVTESLIAQTASTERRSVATERAPSTAQQANTTMPAKLRGERFPEASTAESSAAEFSSALPHASQRIAAEAGQSLLDTGAVKSVAENEPERAVVSGGGNPEIGPWTNVEARRNDRENSGHTPSLDVAQQGPAVTSPPGSSRSAQSSAAQPEEHVAESLRAAGSNLSRSPQHTATPADLRESARASEMQGNALSATRREDRERESTTAAASEKSTENLSGNRRTARSRAPTESAKIQSTASSRATETDDTRRKSAVDSTVTAEDRAVAAPGGATRRTADAPLAATVDSSTGPLHRATGPLDQAIVAAQRESATELSRGRTDRGTAAPTTEMATAGTEIMRSEGVGSALAAEASNVDSVRLAAPVKSPLAAPAGPGGLAAADSLDAGTLSRPATRDSRLVMPESQDRFQRDQLVTVPPSRTNVTAPSEPFRNRDAAGGGGPTTEPAIELGLQFLARYQHSDGKWALEDFDADVPRMAHQFRSDAAATGLALLAFQGAGYTHREYQYAAVIERGLSWLIDHQGSDGCLFVEGDPQSNRSARFYSHAIATLALTEAYGMTRDPVLREPCIRAIAYLEQTQDRTLGGWRYYAALRDRRSDTSVTGWVLMALQSGRLAGLPVREATWQKIGTWLDLARDPIQEGRFRYDPFAPDQQRQQQQASPAMTGVGLLMRFYLGWETTDPRALAAADYLLQSPPGMDSIEQRDTYYWYYATQVLRHIGDDRWRTWNSRLHPLLVQSQVKSGDLAGSWHPYDPVPDRWGLMAGRLYVTTMNLLSLEVDYRLLPLYR